MEARHDGRAVYLISGPPASGKSTVVSARDSARKSSGYKQRSVRELHDAFAVATPRIGLWLDTSQQTPLETVERILARTSAN